MNFIEFEKAIRRAKKLAKEACLATSKLNKYLVFEGFNKDTPNIVIHSNSEILLEYHGVELSIDYAFAVMLSEGRITADEFEFLRQ